ncbi:MAG: DinB family protein [Thermoanaerobaculia bacterium]|nr:DinB family protein [Thermoanaerobaculia bacterium]
MNDRIRNVTEDLERVSAEAKQRLGELSAEQLNWKPAPDRWSVAQCIDHLIEAHQRYFPLFRRLANGEVRMTLWERLSPFSGFFGRFLIKSLHPDNQKKMKTTPKAAPSNSDLGDRIITRFLEHQEELSEHLRALPDDLDAENLIVTSPFLNFLTYSVDDTYTILVVHCQRHLGQAIRVTETEGFPGP